MRIKNESTRNHLEHLSAQEYLSSSLLHSSGSINCDPFGQQQTETLALLSIIPTWSFLVHYRTVWQIPRKMISILHSSFVIWTVLSSWIKAFSSVYILKKIFWFEEKSFEWFYYWFNCLYSPILFTEPNTLQRNVCRGRKIRRI